MATLFGSGLTAATGVVTANTTPLPRESQGTTVWLGGIAAPLLAAANVNGQEQINIQVPFEHVFGYYGLTIRNQGRLGLVTSFSVWDWWPAVFTGADGQPAVLHADYTPVTVSKPAHAGEVVLIYCTGLGSTTPPVATGAAADTAVLQRTVETVTVTLGGANAPVQFAGLAPGYVGLYQVNAQIPAMAGGPQPLTITVRGLETSNPVTMAVQ